MKILTETKALGELRELKTAYQKFIKTNYEHRAADCEVCPTKGACCLDAHFVNVHITRLEAAAIRETLENLDEKTQRKIYRRAEEAIEKYDLKTSGETFQKTYACPLFETGSGCLVHREAKPAPCISHACYENEKDLPPDNFQAEIENQVERLNERTYGKNPVWLPIPVWLELINSFSRIPKNKTAQSNKESAR